MAKDLLNSTISAVTICVALCIAGVGAPAAADTEPSWNRTAPPAASDRRPSMLESIGSTFQKGMGKLADTLAPKAPITPADDPVALRTKAAPSAELYVRVAHLYEGSGKLKEAAEQYEKALSTTPDYLGALLGYARLKDFLGQPEEAIKFYQRAAAVHPQEPSVYNNLALFYARRRMLDRSVAMIGRAIQLEPNNPKYRNNMATVLVEMGQVQDAFGHLQLVHPEAVAYYNLGYLLEKRGESDAAAQHFMMALQKDASLIQAGQALQRLAAARMSAERPIDVREAEPRLGHLPARSFNPTHVQTPTDSGQRPQVRQLPPVPPRPRFEPPGLPPEVHPLAPSTGAYAPDATIPQRLPPVTGRNVSDPQSAPLPPRAPLPPMETDRRQPIQDAPLPAADIPDRVAQPPRRVY